MIEDATIYQGREPDLRQADVNIVIDVLRAFTTTHVAFDRGCREVLLAREVEQAFDLSDAYPDYLLAGERNARKVDGFDIGNSPWDFSRLDLDERGVVLTTTNGVRATTHALDADHVVVTGWSNAEATLRYTSHVAEEVNDARVNLVASHPHSDEDVACADWLRARLLDREPPNESEVVERIRSAQSAQKFYGPEFSIRDLDLACQTHPPRFAMCVSLRGDAPVLEAREFQA